RAVGAPDDGLVEVRVLAEAPERGTSRGVARFEASAQLDLRDRDSRAFQTRERVARLFQLDRGMARVEANADVFAQDPLLRARAAREFLLVEAQEVARRLEEARGLWLEREDDPPPGVARDRRKAARHLEDARGGLFERES